MTDRGDPLIPELRDLLGSLDYRGAVVLRRLGELRVSGQHDVADRTTTALTVGLATRLVAFALGPAGAIQPGEVERTALDIVAVLNERQQDLLAVPKGKQS